ncbi:hypothetical protein ADK36_21705 [Streptomyces viridochromogenes]|nr:hypothetical protein ADK36_21705 [Streptomyces viridochromogenes]
MAHIVGVGGGSAEGTSRRVLAPAGGTVRGPSQPTPGSTAAVRSPQHLHMCLPHPRPRLHTEFLDQAHAQVAVDGEGLGAAAGAVQGEHQVAVEGLAQRMFGGQCRQFRDESVEAWTGDGQPGVVTQLQEQQPRLRQALDECVAAHLGGQAVQGGAPPQRERGRALAHRALPVPFGVRGAGHGDTAHEDVDVQFALVHAQHIAGRHRAQPFGVVEQPAQPGHVVVQRGPRRRGRRAAPQRVRQRLHGDDPAAFEQQRGEQGSHLGAADDPNGTVGHARRVMLGA